MLFPFSLRIAALIFRAARDIKGFLVEPRYHEPPFQAAMNLSRACRVKVSRSGGISVQEKHPWLFV